MGHNLKHTLYEGDWLRLVRIDHWESCERTHGQGMAVIIIAVTPADEVLFVEQFRVPLGARTIEMPAGLVGDDHAQDTLEDAARRELIEETGETATESRGRPAMLFRYRPAVLEARALAGTRLPVSRG